VPRRRPGRISGSSRGMIASDPVEIQHSWTASPHSGRPSFICSNSLVRPALPKQCGVFNRCPCQPLVRTRTQGRGLFVASTCTTLSVSWFYFSVFQARRRCRTEGPVMYGLFRGFRWMCTSTCTCQLTNTKAHRS
jgi:hypothetical protein